MRKGQALVAGLVSLIVLATMPAGAQAGPKKDRVRGIGRVAEPSGGSPPPAEIVDVRVNARSGALGEAARGRFFFRHWIDGETLVDIHVSVTCLRVVRMVLPLRGTAVDVATVGGVVARSRAPHVAEGEAFVIAVFDGDNIGSGDGIVWGVAESPTTCPDPEEILSGPFITLADGDLDVQEASP